MRKKQSSATNKQTHVVYIYVFVWSIALRLKQKHDLSSTLGSYLGTHTHILCVPRVIGAMAAFLRCSQSYYLRISFLKKEKKHSLSPKKKEQFSLEINLESVVFLTKNVPLPLVLKYSLSATVTTTTKSTVLLLISAIKHKACAILHQEIQQQTQSLCKACAILHQEIQQQTQSLCNSASRNTTTESKSTFEKFNKQLLHSVSKSRSYAIWNRDNGNCILYYYNFYIYIYIQIKV